MASTRNVANLQEAMTKGQHAEAQERLGRPVSFVDDGPGLRRNTRRASPHSEYSVVDKYVTHKA